HIKDTKGHYMPDLITHNPDLHTKAERIASAIFLISESINESALKSKLRELSMGLISSSLHIKDNNGSDRLTQSRLLEKIIMEIMSLMDVSFVSGYISEMNSSLLKKELNSFLANTKSLIET